MNRERLHVVAALLALGLTALFGPPVVASVGRAARLARDKARADVRAANADERAAAALERLAAAWERRGPLDPLRDAVAAPRESVQPLPGYSRP